MGGGRWIGNNKVVELKKKEKKKKKRWTQTHRWDWQMQAENISGGTELRDLAGTGETQKARGEVLVLKDDPEPHKPTPCPGPILHRFPAPEPWLGCLLLTTHTWLLSILILRDALGIGPNRQMASFLLLLCLSIFFPTSRDEGGNHAHCILIRLDVLKEERE